MNFAYISGADWQTFQEKHPGAYSFLQGASLRGEEASLRAELTRNPDWRRKGWIEQRLADFDRVSEAFSGLTEAERNHLKTDAD